MRFTKNTTRKVVIRAFRIEFYQLIQLIIKILVKLVCVIIDSIQGARK